MGMIPSALRHLIPLLDVDASPQQPQGECQLRDKSDWKNRREQEPRRKRRGEHLCNAKGDVTVARNRDQDTDDSGQVSRPLDEMAEQAAAEAKKQQAGAVAKAMHSQKNVCKVVQLRRRQSLQIAGSLQRDEGCDLKELGDTIDSDERQSEERREQGQISAHRLQQHKKDHGQRHITHAREHLSREADPEECLGAHDVAGSGGSVAPADKPVPDDELTEASSHNDEQIEQPADSGIDLRRCRDAAVGHSRHLFSTALGPQTSAQQTYQSYKRL